MRLFGLSIWQFLVLLLIIVVPFLVFAVQVGWLPAYSEYCDKNEYTGAKECANYYSAFVFWFHLTKILETYSGAIVGVATVFIAWLTFEMARSTRALQDLAAQQEKTARVHERAYVIGALSDRTREPTYDNDMKLVTWHTRIAAVNNGRTPASIKEVYWTIRLQKDLPNTPEYANRKRVYLELPPQDRFDTKAHLYFDFTIEEPQVVFGKLVYEDVFRKRHTARFLVGISRGIIDGREVAMYDPIEGFPEYLDWD